MGFLRAKALREFGNRTAITASELDESTVVLAPA